MLAKYWLKDRDRANRLGQINRYLPPAKAVRKKDEHWLELWQLEAIGLSQYPYNARHLRSVDRPRSPFWERQPLTSTAYAVEASLILRLLIRIPYRQRNIREMRLQQNLRQRLARLLPFCRKYLQMQRFI